MSFIGGKILLLSIDRPPSRCEDKTANAGAARGLEQVERACDVLRRVELRITHRESYIELCGMVVDEIEAA